MSDSSRWKFWIDGGGTFTDCIGVSPEGVEHTTKVLSGLDAPLRGIRTLLNIAPSTPIPPCELRLGTTLATNALLERRGVATALLVTKGFRDILAIGNQSRPDLFALDIVKPEMLYREVVEIEARLGWEGNVLQRPDSEDLRIIFSALKDREIQSIAILVLHSYRNSELEEDIAEIARELGFTDIAISSEVAGEIGMQGRGDTAIVDAYLTPVLRNYLHELREQLPGSDIAVMQSSGGLVELDGFRGKNAVLSGPAGGVIAYTEIAKRAGFARSIGFDMGGTSTDVSCFTGELSRQYEATIAGVRLRAAMLDIHTVAAGGGSVCTDNGFRFSVGPQSAGSVPGPICYGNAAANQLTVTDCNLVLGRVVDDKFPFSLDAEKVMKYLQTIATERETTPAEVAEGFIQIANANMASAIREVTLAKGRDLREFVMVVFGGAGGQHGCAIARLLGVKTLLIHPLSGVLSALGMGMAPLRWHAESDGKTLLLSQLSELEDDFSNLEHRGNLALPQADVSIRRLDLRYVGTDSTISIVASPDAREKFRAIHFQQNGYNKECEIEIVTIRVEKIRYVRQPVVADTSEEGQRQNVALPSPLRLQSQWNGKGFVDTPVYAREELAAGMVLAGPALILDNTATHCLDLDWSASVDPLGNLLFRDTASAVQRTLADSQHPDPVGLEIYANLFMSIATQMGKTLENTAVSVNIRERLDFSCALFDAQGNLIANAPHMPVHLGAMGESIRGVLQLHPNPAPGSVYATNDPALGGSHLPDITVVTPVHDDSGTLLFFTASRGHHSDVGGISPGSMPAFSRSLSEEGIVLKAVQIVKEGRFLEDELREKLASGPHPARCADNNVADLKAQVAANLRGAKLLGEVLQEQGSNTVLEYMQHVQDSAAQEVAARIEELADGEYRFSDAMDDGTAIAMCATVKGSHVAFDFADTGPQSEGNLNAPLAVTRAAVMYVLRCMLQSNIPLNAGFMRNVTLRVPRGCILNPDPGRAVAAGNVETSQRVVDVLLGGLNLAAASQGTMNNLSFGNETFGYYETIAGGAGATGHASGADGVHTHMTNTRIADPEILESRFPVRLHEFSIRPNSGGTGRNRGGNGLIRDIEMLAPLQVSIISERRSRAPFGLQGGTPGLCGHNRHNGKALAAKVTLETEVGDRICIETPGGGGYGTAS